MIACSTGDNITSPDLRVASARGTTTTTAPVVTSTSPSTSVRNVTLNVRILGSGFDRGSAAQWAIKGVPSSKVTTNSTTYVSSKELVANITIAADADIAYYDVVVTAASGKPGIGTETFEVVVQTTDLGTLGGADAEATAINDAGQIVGGSYTSRGVNKPFLWEDGVMRDLGMPAGGTWGRASGLNSTGTVVVGNYATSVFKPFIWRSGTGISTLPLPAGVVTGYAMGVNDAGSIVGSVDEISRSHAVVWNNGVITDIHPLAGGASEAWSISSAGDVLGAYHPAGTPPNDDGVAFIRTSSGEVVWLPCSSGYSCRGGSINASGDVVGTIRNLANGVTYAYKWVDRGRGTHGPIAGAGTTGAAISDAGFAAGTFSFSIWQSSGSALWGTDGSMVELQSESNNTRAQGSAFSVNSSGWVVGYQVKTIKGQAVHRAVRWRYPLA